MKNVYIASVVRKICITEIAIVYYYNQDDVKLRYHADTITKFVLFYMESNFLP